MSRRGRGTRPGQRPCHPSFHILSGFLNEDQMHIRHVYDWLIVGLATLAGIILVFVTGSIIVDVMLRNLGFSPMRWTSAVVEYALLFVTMAGAPWLVRTNGHVAITSFVALLPERPRRIVARAGLLLSIAVLSILSWRASLLTMETFASGTVDVRSINIPSWVLYAMLAGGFCLMALEFLRLLLRGETFTGASGAH